MKIDSRCMGRFLNAKLGKAIGEKTVNLLLSEMNDNNADNAELALGFMNPDELDDPEDGSAEILLKIVVRSIGDGETE
jgi:hypothetical protein